jgi:glutathione synthase/RimK-type ligase-like ATP-grasp enzyme
MAKLKAGAPCLMTLCHWQLPPAADASCLGKVHEYAGLLAAGSIDIHADGRLVAVASKPISLADGNGAAGLASFYDAIERIAVRLAAIRARPSSTQLRLRVPDTNISASTVRAAAEVAAPALLVLLSNVAAEDQAIHISTEGDTVLLSLPPGIGWGLRRERLAVAIAAGLVGVLTAEAGMGLLPLSLTRHPQLVRGCEDALKVPLRRDGRLVLAQGRLSRVRGVDASGQPVGLSAQSALTALFLHSEAAVAALIRVTDWDTATALVLGELPLPIDEAPVEPATPGTPNHSSPRAPVPADRETARPLLAFVSLGMRPPRGGTRSWPRDIPDPGRVGRGLLRFARQGTRAHQGDVVVCPWYQVELSGGGVSVRGPVLTGRQGRLVPEQWDEPRWPDAMLFYPVSGSGTPGVTAVEQHAVCQLEAAGLNCDGAARHHLVGRILLEAARRGLVTNATGLEGAWWRKDNLEFGLRAYARATGIRIPRPRTFVVHGQHIPEVLRWYAAHGLAAIIKPAFGSRAESIEVVPAGTPLRPNWPDGVFAVQDLIRNPYLVGGHKIDLRCYVLVDTANRSRSRRVGPVLARVAPLPYRHGVESAEITGTSFSERLGLRACTRLWETLDGVPGEVRAQLPTQLDRLTDGLLDALDWWVERTREQRGLDRATRRVQLWGLDVLPRKVDGRLAVALLELNVYPLLFRGSRSCDTAVDRMLREDLLPAVWAGIEERRAGQESRPCTNPSSQPNPPGDRPRMASRQLRACVQMNKKLVGTLLTTRVGNPTTRGLVSACARRGMLLRPQGVLADASLVGFHWGYDGRDVRKVLAEARRAAGSAGIELVNPRLLDKWAQYDTLVSAGLPVPASRLARSLEEALTAAQLLGWPIVLKPLMGSYSNHVVVARDDGELRAAWTGRPRLVQEYLPDGDRCARLLVIDGKVTSAVLRVAYDGIHATYDHGRRAAVQRLRYADDAFSLAIAACRILGIGVGGADLVHTDSGPVVLEVNHRGVEFHVAELHGHDAIDQIADYLIRLAGANR